MTDLLQFRNYGTVPWHKLSNLGRYNRVTVDEHGIQYQRMIWVIIPRVLEGATVGHYIRFADITGVDVRHHKPPFPYSIMYRIFGEKVVSIWVQSKGAYPSLSLNYIPGSLAQRFLDLLPKSVPVNDHWSE